MNEDLRDLSSLPDDPAYWDALERRVMSTLRDPSSAHTPHIPTAWYVPMVRRLPVLGALAAAAAVAMFVMPGREAPVRAPQSADASADPTLALLAGADAPPALATLLVASASPRTP